LQDIKRQGQKDPSTCFLEQCDASLQKDHPLRFNIFSGNQAIEVNPAGDSRVPLYLIDDANASSTPTMIPK
jgi:hypothetical protein